MSLRFFSVEIAAATKKKEHIFARCRIAVPVFDVPKENMTVVTKSEIKRYRFNNRY